MVVSKPPDTPPKTWAEMAARMFVLMQEAVQRLEQLRDETRGTERLELSYIAAVFAVGKTVRKEAAEDADGAYAAADRGLRDSARDAVAGVDLGALEFGGGPEQAES